MAVVNSSCKYVLVDGAEGRVSDGGLFKNSEFGKALVKGGLNIPSLGLLAKTTTAVPHVFVGDKAFQLRKDFMRPLPSKTRGDLEDERSLQLQVDPSKVYGEDFKVFVDVSDDIVIIDKFKVQLKEVSEYRVVDVLDVEVAQMTLQVAPTFMSYTLPPVPLDIQMAIEKHRGEMHFEKRQRLIQWFFHDLCSYGM
ncbi:hypothetical protein HPB49_026458 [Dermacentor silvarum]|nr:hypothetical protein HPB49_026458 [Dermacentor silvarum]